MIKFFRRIRRNLLSEGNTGKYFKYAIGEIILVVIGIIIALQINTWNENRKLNNLKQNYYEQILVDLENDKKYAEEVIRYFDSLQTQYNDYNQIFRKPNLSFTFIVQNLSQLEIDILNIRFKSTTVTSLINNGEITLMNPQLRNSLTDYNTFKEHILDVYLRNSSGAIDILKTTSKDGAIISALQRISNQTELATIFNLENHLPQIYSGLEAYHYWKSIAERRASDGLKDLIEEMDVCIGLIELQLGK
jgi:hypothetical protein